MLCVVLLFCASIIQGQGVSVTNNEGEVTRYPLTNSITFLAHDYLDGKYFSEIEIGDTIIYLDGDPSTRSLYKVTEIIAAQASDPQSVTTDLWIDGQWMDVAQAYERVGYTDQRKLVLQTCISTDVPAWGRLFVIAKPVVEVSH